VTAIPRLNSQISILGSEIEKFVIQRSQDLNMGLGVQIGCYFGIYNKLISWIWCGRLEWKTGQKGV